MEVQIVHKGEKIMLDLKLTQRAMDTEPFIAVMSAYYLDKGELMFTEIPDSLLEEIYHNFDIEELYLGASK